ncbi:MAG: redoxin domain-containing protein [Flavobacteriales bacterium]|nr:redoxin domain-containing protein [Flavobacteriales bacterium]
MRTLLSALTALLAHAAPAIATLQIEAPERAGQQVVLHRMDDLFTLRTTRVDGTLIGADGRATLKAEVQGTTKALLIVGGHRAELFLRDGATYRVRPLPPAPGARPVKGHLPIVLEFIDLPPLDINALMTDLYERLDGFVAEDLATDEAAGMQAVDVLRREGDRTLQADSVKRPATLFYTPSWSQARLDSFAFKLKRFYADVDDPWFQRNVELGLCGLYLGPQQEPEALHVRCLSGHEPDIDKPEFVRLFRSLYEDHLMTHPFRTDERRLVDGVKQAATDSLIALVMEHPPFRQDRALAELLLIDQVYLARPGKVLDRGGIERVLADVAARSGYPGHRTLAANMLWDLTAMRPGTGLPDLALNDLQGTPVPLDSVFSGPVCLVLTTVGCTYCEQELRALAQLQESFGDVVRYVVLVLDSDAGAAVRLSRSIGGTGWTWLQARDPERAREQLRAPTAPAFLLLNDRTLAQSPAPAPSQGLAAVLHGMRTQQEERDRIKFGSEAPPPPRR